MEPAIVDRVYAAKGNMLAADALIRDYLPFIKAETSKVTHRIVAEGQDDELSIAMIGFHEAVQSYSRLKGAFLKYAALVMRHRIIDYQRREGRHSGNLSLNESSSVGGEHSIADVLPDKADDFEEMHTRDATRQEIAELSAQLNDFGLSLSDVSENCPKQDRTFAACQKALGYARENPALIAELIRTKKLPLAQLAEGAKVERKTLERHRKYIMALLIIYSNGYDIIRGHLKQVLSTRKGGEQK